MVTQLLVDIQQLPRAPNWRQDPSSQLLFKKVVADFIDDGRLYLPSWLVRDSLAYRIQCSACNHTFAPILCRETPKKGF